MEEVVALARLLWVELGVLSNSTTNKNLELGAPCAETGATPRIREYHAQQASSEEM